MNEISIPWPVLIAVVALILGLVAIVWQRLLDGQKDQKTDVAEIYKRLLKEAEARHELAINLAVNYPRSDTLRATVDGALEPVKIQLSHLSEGMRDLREEFHEHRKEHTA